MPGNDKSNQEAGVGELTAPGGESIIITLLNGQAGYQPALSTLISLLID